MPPRKLVVGSGQRTHPLVWIAAIICVFLALAVIIAGVCVFVGYLVIHPRVPALTVTDAHLDRLDFSQAGVMDVKMTVYIRAENHNIKAHASFSDTSLTMSFHEIEIAKLVAYPFDVSKNSSIDFNYVVESSSIPLGSRDMDFVDRSLKEDKIKFDLKGSSRTQWRIPILGSVKLWCHLNCELRFHPSNSSYIHSYCSSKSK
ncbi:hypothetical protein PVL29_002632 [Vitis rotundifolia]|uniref:Late embryogenesis abundant protein LEA-2 subgroup domain-containing protein n=1 Tax=Vitis rotundifolia TaxID=103349 RepID=A0AA39E8I0_VITRO|nr:hypothetical protein PVL29_002632 [Vitis rotundifolia]